MKKQITKCDECGTIIESETDDVVSIIKMAVMMKNRMEFVVSGGSFAPDFCGVPCLLKWISNKLTGGANGNQSK